MTTDRNVDKGTEKKKVIPFSEIYSALDLSLERHVTNIYVYSSIFTITLYRFTLRFKEKCSAK